MSNSRRYMDFYIEYINPSEMVGNSLGYPTYVLQAGAFLAVWFFVLHALSIKHAVFNVSVIKVNPAEAEVPNK